jgi:multidrug resistance protein
VQSLKSGDPGKLAVLMATAFIDMVGALIIIPLLPFYAERFGANDFKVMVLVSAFSAMQLVSAPLWGRVSDRYGRKPALIIGLTGSMIAYIVFAFADSYWLLLLSRVVQGAGGGTTGVIQAYVADSLEPRHRAKGLGWLSAATNAGVVLGPLIGSATTSLGSHWPGLLAALLCFLNILFATRYLTESHKVSRASRAKGGRRPLEIVLRIVSWRHLGEPASRLIWMYAVGIGAFYGVNALIILYLGRHFGVTTETVGPFFAYMGGLSIVFRLLVLGKAVDRLGEARTARLGATLLAVGLALIPFTGPFHVPGFTYLPLALVLALIPLGTALNFPCVTALLSSVVKEDERGMYMGVQQTYGGLSRVLYPLAAGALSDSFGEGAPFWLSAVLVVSTVFMGLGLERYGRHDEAAAVAEAKKPETTKEQAAVGE